MANIREPASSTPNRDRNGTANTADSARTTARLFRRPLPECTDFDIDTEPPLPPVWKVAGPDATAVVSADVKTALDVTRLSFVPTITTKNDTATIGTGMITFGVERASAAKIIKQYFKSELEDALYGRMTQNETMTEDMVVLCIESAIDSMTDKLMGKGKGRAELRECFEQVGGEVVFYKPCIVDAAGE